MNVEKAVTGDFIYLFYFLKDFRVIQARIVASPFGI